MNNPSPPSELAHAPANPAPHPAHDLAARLASILGPLLQLIRARFPALGDYFLPLHARIVRAHRRLATLLARLAAGKFPRPRIRAPRSGTKGGPPAPYLPRRRTWLVVALGHYAAGHASQLHFLLHDPATLATLAAAPPEALKSAARTLRPLCHILGVDLPAILKPPPKPPRPKPAKPEKPPHPARQPMRPIYPQHRPRDLPFLRRRKIAPA